MKKFFSSMGEALHFWGRIICDTFPKKGAVDSVYVFAMHENDANFMLEKGAELECMADKIVYLRGGKLVTGETFESDYGEKLVRLGVAEEKLVCTDIPNNTAHTHTEAIAVTNLAKMMGWKKMYVVSSPTHLPRAFAEMVTAVLNSYPALKVYAQVARIDSWLGGMVSYQGLLDSRRCDLFEPEAERLEKYFAKGDLVTARDVLEYLNARDSSGQS